MIIHKLYSVVHLFFFVVPTIHARMMNISVQFTTEWSQLEKADVVVEAVPESIDLKKTVFQEMIKVIAFYSHP